LLHGLPNIGRLPSSRPCGLRVQVVVKDGRVLLGELNCLDKQGNIILANTYEQLDLNGR
jgi:small nuclear ribonucleoprotein (snRNP)-like protein